MVLLLVAVGISKADTLSAKQTQLQKAQQSFLAKDAGVVGRFPVNLPYIKTSIMVTYTPVSQRAGGTWQLLLLAPDGTLYQDEGHKRIDVLNPVDPAEGNMAPFHFKLPEGPYPVGTWSLIVYMKERDNTLPVNMRTLAQDVSIFMGDRRMLVTQPADFFSGNATSTRAGESAQLFFAVCDPKHQLPHHHH